ncbi:MAG: HAMP domain-containing histidine kinase [Cytophagales bacterium]|nr:HAMP domain-containing histidine kinase [Cytophagales bacterium]
MNYDKLESELDQIKNEKYNLLKLINHDIRSPFNRVFALLQLFEMENIPITEQQKAYVNSMYLSVLSGLEMITNLRDMREIDAGHITVEKKEFSLLNSMSKAVRSFSKQLEIKRQHLNSELTIDQANCFSDEYYVQRIIENVLSNAIKFSGQEKEITIRLNRNADAYEIEIEDCGDGIKEDEEHLLFQKFQKLSSIATGGEGCLGLGLHNTKYFLNQLEGNIELKRNENPGSTFVIQLPVK